MKSELSEKDICPGDGAPCWIAGTPTTPDDKHWRCGTFSCGRVNKLKQAPPPGVSSDAAFIRALSRGSLEALCIKQHGDLVKAERQHAPGILEEAVEWMIARSYATGHGDTVSDLMAELAEQVRERALKDAAAMLDENAAHLNFIRDPGMANHDRAMAERIRKLIVPK